MKFYLVRHGQSEGNLKRFYCGHTDVELTETGIIQAKNMAKYFENIEIEKIYSSPLKRAYNTAMEISKVKNIDITVNNLLMERNFGIFEGMSWEEIEYTYPDEAKKFLEQDAKYNFLNGESWDELLKRVSKVLDNITDKSVLVTHGLFIRSLLIYLNIIDFKSIWEVPIHNCSVVCIENNKLIDIVSNS